MDNAEVVLDTRKTACRHAAARKPAAQKQSRTLYDVAIKSGWGPRLNGMDKAIAHLEQTPA